MPKAKSILAIAAGWLAISTAPLWKYLSHPKAIAAAAFGVLGIATGMLIVDRLNRRGWQPGYGWLAALYLLLAVAILILYPLSLRHTFNAGSDREDAIRVSLNAIQHHQFPYSARTYLNNPPTPLPGALLLATPFHALGHIVWQNLFWTALFFLLSLRIFRHRATALFFLTLFFLCTPVVINDLVTGGDYIINFLYITIAVVLFVSALQRRLPVAMLAAAFLGIAISSRAIYPLVLIPLLALTLQRSSRGRTAALFTVVTATAAAVTLPVFTPHPLTRLLHQLMLTSSNVVTLPHSLHLVIILPLLALLILGSAFFLQMNLQCLSLLFALATVIILAPPAIAQALLGNTTAVSYLAVPVMAMSLCVLARYEIADKSAQPAHA